MAKTEVKAEPVRQYQRLDSIAIARQADDIKTRRREIEVAELSMNSQPINGNGYGDRGYMMGQVAQQIAERRELLREAESLTGDELVIRYCQDCLTPQSPAYSGITVNGEPIGRGAVPSSFAPGMNSARV